MSQLILDTRFKAEDLFSSLEPEDEQDFERKMLVETSPTLGKIFNSFEKYRTSKQRYGGSEIYDRDEWYRVALRIIANDLKGGVSPGDIALFSMHLSRYEGEDLCKHRSPFYSSGAPVGIFIGAMIETSKDNDYQIFTVKGNTLIDLIGFNNSKNITVRGNIGRYAGKEMKDGNLIIHGNPSGNIGDNMRDGKIIVNGNVISRDLDGMDGVGWYLRGGEIHLNGDYTFISEETIGGNIYHKGKLIVEDGRRLE